MKKLGIIGLIFILVFFVALSGCTSMQDKKYSGNGINFTYPGDMKPNATFIWVVSPPANQSVDTLGNDKLVLATTYSKIPEGISQLATMDAYKSMVWTSLNSNNDSKINQLGVKDLSNFGTTIFEEIYTSKDPVSGVELKNIKLVIFKDMNGVSLLYFQTKASDFESQQATISKIINSTVLT